MATRMVGGFILVAFLLCILQAWPGQRRWPVWLSGGICLSTCAALTVTIGADGGGLPSWAGLLAVVVAVAFVLTGVAMDLRKPIS